MRVRDWMSLDPVTVTPATDAREARRLLHRYGIRHLPVVDGRRVIGMVSDRDVRVDEFSLAHVPAEDRDELFEAGPRIEAVMSSPAHVIAPDEPIEAAARLLLSRRISSLPVVDADGALMGIITSTDCLLALLTPADTSTG